MIKLLNGDVCTELKVSPKNWETNKGAVKKDWFIYYRMYKAGRKNGRLIIIKGMNHLHGFNDRVSKTKELIDAELKRLKNEAVNDQSVSDGKNELQILTASTSFNDAITIAKERLHVAECTKSDIKVIVNMVCCASAKL